MFSRLRRRLEALLDAPADFSARPRSPADVAEKPQSPRSFSKVLWRLAIVLIAIHGFDAAATATPTEHVANNTSSSAQQSVLEAYQEAELIVRGIGSRDSHIKRLRELQKSYSRQNPDDGDDLFWREVAMKFLPAVEENDGPVVATSFGRLVRLYGAVNSSTTRESRNLDQVGAKDNVARVEASAPNAEVDSLLTALEWVPIPIAAAACVFWLQRRRRQRKLAAIAQAALSSKETEKQAHDSLDIKLSALRASLYAYGQPRRDSDMLFFGKYAVNGNNEIVDKVKNDFGCFATIFVGDKRISTNVLLGNGSRALDTPLVHGPAYETVVENKRLFAGRVVLFGRSILALYEPIFNGPDVIGILFVGS